MAQLIICEKPSAMKNIANALADKKPKQNNHESGASYYTLERNGEKIIVGCAVGHLFNLKERNKKGWTYPIFDLEWVESHETNKSALFTKKYLDTLKELVKQAKEFYNGCDFDVEGETIFSLILEKVIKKKDAKRMKFSTMTKEELIDAYEHALPHLDKFMAEAGRSRHFVDFLYGINLSRALTLSIKNATNRFKILSSGRVQGPALKILANREIEIQNFKSVPFWEIEALGVINSKHKNDKFWDKKEVEKVYNKIKDEKKATIKKVTKKIQDQAPPNPFDLTALQLEAYRIFKISPKDTLSIAQELYISACISYPRTSSNQLFPSLNFRKLFQDLAKQPQYKELAEEIMRTKLTPNNGKKTDPAHPAIYFTGVVPKKLSERSKKIYDLLVRRTLATFADAAKRESITVILDIKDEPFLASGSRTIYPGWHKFYGRYANVKEAELPEVKEEEAIQIKKINLLSKETQAPKRYTPASIIKELESHGLGTKATRSQIVESLYQRYYVVDQQIKVTELGLKTVQTLEKYCPEILDEKMTRDLEEHMEQIREGKNKKENVLEEAKKDLTKILGNFKKNERDIGIALSEATLSTQNELNKLGPCPKCNLGSLRIIKMKNGSNFVGCSSYPECNNTYNLPNNALIQKENKSCKSCDFIQVRVIRKGKRPWVLCLNPGCPAKKEWLEKQAKKV